MKLLQSAMIILFATAIAAPIMTATPASAWKKKKCYHCYYTAYGKKICHNDCKCYGTH